MKENSVKGLIARETTEKNLIKGPMARRKLREIKKPEHTPKTHFLVVGGELADIVLACIDHRNENRKENDFYEERFKGFVVIFDDNTEMEFRQK